MTVTIFKIKKNKSSLRGLLSPGALFLTTRTFNLIKLNCLSSPTVLIYSHSYHCLAYPGNILHTEHPHALHLQSYLKVGSTTPRIWLILACFAFG